MADHPTGIHETPEACDQIPTCTTKSWQRGRSGELWRKILTTIIVVQFVGLVCGLSFLLSRSGKDQKNGINRFAMCFALNIVFEIVSETWLDVARLSTLSRRDLMENTGAASSVVEAQRRRQLFHVARLQENQLSSLPYLGPDNWHYETSACMRDAILSFTMFTLYVASPEIFAAWWNMLTLATYFAAMLILLARWPFVSASWLKFVSLHHIFSIFFVTLMSFRVPSYHPSAYRAIALIWLSNVFTTYPVVHRAFFGRENSAMIVAGIIGQRLLRWGGVLSFVIQIAIQGGIHEYLIGKSLVTGVVGFLVLEVLDVSTQAKKIVQIVNDARQQSTSTTDQGGAFNITSQLMQKTQPLDLEEQVYTLEREEKNNSSSDVEEVA